MLVSHDLMLRYVGNAYLDRMAAFRTGDVIVPGAALALEEVPCGSASVEALYGGRADLAEVPLVDVAQALARGDDRWIALPVFPSRSFVLGFLRRTEDRAPLETPAALADRAIGLAEEDLTIGIWVHATLSEGFGTDLQGSRWEQGTEVTLHARLEAGLVASLVSTSSSGAGSRFPPLFPQHQDLDRSAYDRTQMFPLLSVVVMNRGLYERHRWLAASLVDSFCESKEVGDRRHRYFGALSVGLPWLQPAVREVDEQFGGDAFAYGLERNLSALSTFSRFAVAHGVVERELDMSQAFAPETRSHPGVSESTFYTVPLSHA